jgi:hypothetical protein
MIDRRTIRRVWPLCDQIDAILNDAPDVATAMTRLARLRTRFGNADYKLAYEACQKAFELTEAEHVTGDRDN